MRIGEFDQLQNAAFAVAIAAFVSALITLAYVPTTSFVFDGFTLAIASPDTQSPPIRFI